MISHCMRLLGVVACVAVIMPMGAAAQTDTTVTAVAASPPRSLCWRPRPAPACRAYYPTEFTVELPLASTSAPIGASREDDFARRYVSAVGLMRNLGTSAALGGMLGMDVDEYRGPGLTRVEGRYRQWVGSRAGVDLGVGFAQRWVPTGNVSEPVRARGLTAGIALDFPYGGVDVRVDRLRGGGSSRNGVLVGMHASWLAAPTAAGIAFLIGVGKALSSLGF